MATTKISSCSKNSYSKPHEHELRKDESQTHMDVDFRDLVSQKTKFIPHTHFLDETAGSKKNLLVCELKDTNKTRLRCH